MASAEEHTILPRPEFDKPVKLLIVVSPYYKDIAAVLGKPGAARAVGRACATNPVAVVIPCHRAVSTGGKLTGYRWGLGRKKKLLDGERGD